MNREILFRGKRTDNDEWVYGCLLVYADGSCFICREYRPCKFNKLLVDPATIGQYTGAEIRDAKIFEGDIIRRYDGRSFEVLWSALYVQWEAHHIGSFGSWNLKTVLSKGPCEIVGNIWDNPELLEVKK